VNEIVISGGTLVDGTGRPGVRSDLGILNGIVAEVAAPGEVVGRQRIDATGLVVAPGFIDPHAHLDAMLLAEPAFEAGLRQGITTVVLGSDGCGYAPASEATLEFMRTSIAGFSGNPASIGWEWRSLPEYMARFDHGQVAPNTAFLLPYGCLRSDAMGLADRPPTDAEQAAMCRAARAGMRDGAVGFSWGYHYPPNTYAGVEDLVAIGRAVGPEAVFSTHMRDYENEIGPSLEEAFTVGSECGLRTHVSHLNMHWEQGLPPIEAARARGVDASFDTYPYLAGYTVMTRHLPDWALAGGTEATLARLVDPATRNRLRPWLEAPERRWGSMLLGSIGAEQFRSLQGRPPVEAAESLGQSITEFVCDLLVASRLEVGVIGFRNHRQNEDDLRRLLGHPHQVVASDGIFVGTNPHPRGFGTFAKVLGLYVRDEGLLGLEEAVRKMTSSTSRIFGLGAAMPRGTIRGGAAADIVVFDPSTVADRATYRDGRATAVGVETVLVNGTPAVLGATLTGDLAGRVIHGRGAQA
jgi:N-acyl-D-amino-acid deacylase